MKFRREVASFVVIFAMATPFEGGCAGAPAPLVVDEQAARIDRVEVASRFITIPAGRFLLARHGSDMCAIRFIEFRRGHDAHPATRFSSGEERFGATYEWYHQSDGGGDLHKGNVASGRSDLLAKPLIGLGHYAFQPGTTEMKCGPIRLGWIYPNQVRLEERPGRQEKAPELAPTNWKQIEEVDAHDSRLKWYRYDPNRRIISVPVDKLF